MFADTYPIALDNTSNHVEINALAIFATKKKPRKITKLCTETKESWTMW